MPPMTTMPARETRATGPRYDAAQRIVLAASLVLGPLLTGLAVAVAPIIGARSGGEAIGAYAANAGAAQLELVVFGLPAVVFLPLGIVGLARLALRRPSWLATIGSGLALVGWMTLPAFQAQDTMTQEMANLGGGTQFVSLWDTFNAGLVLNALLLLFIIGHVVGTMLLGIALGRSRLLPRWAAMALVLFSPLQVARFLTGIPALGVLAYAMLVVGCSAAARATVTIRD